MCADLEQRLRGVRPDLTPSSAMAARLRARLDLDAPGDARRVSRRTRLFVVAALAMAGGSAVTAAVVQYRATPTPALAPQPATRWSAPTVLARGLAPWAFQQPAAAVTRDGYAVVAWTRGSRLLYRVRPPRGTWAPSVRMPVSGLLPGHVRLAAVGPTRVVVAWRDVQGGRLVRLPLVDPQGRAFGVLSRRVDTRYALHARVIDLATGRMTPIHDLTSPTARRGDLKQLRLAVDGAGVVTAVWDREGRVETARMAANETWSAAELVPAETVAPIRRVSLAVSPSGRAAVAWTTMRAAQGRLQASRRDAQGGWTSASVSDAATNDAPSVAIADDGRAWVAWIAPEQPLSGPAMVKSVSADGAWAPAERLSPQGRVAATVVIGAQPGGDVVAVWGEVTPRPSPAPGNAFRVALRQATFDGRAWISTRVVDGAGWWPVATAGAMPADGSGRLIQAVFAARGVGVLTWSGPDAPVRLTTTSVRGGFLDRTLAAGPDGTAVVAMTRFRGSPESQSVVAAVREPIPGG